MIIALDGLALLICSTFAKKKDKMPFDLTKVAKRYLSNVQSFSTVHTDEKILADETFIGVSRNTTSDYIVFTDKRLYIHSDESVRAVEFIELSKAWMPILRPEHKDHGDWKKVIGQDKSVRQLELTFLSGETIMMPVENDVGDVFAMQHFMWKVLHRSA